MSFGRMVLVVEGNTPELIERGSSVGAPPPGLHYGTVLRELDPSLVIQIVTPSFPEYDLEAVSFDGVVGVALTGASVPWSADAREAEPHRAFLQRAFDQNLPVFGSCYGLHLATVVLGGAVRQCPRGPEFGLARNVALTEAGRRHQMFAGKPAAFDSVCMHADEVERPPEGAAILASNAHSSVQAMAYQNGGVRFWGAQYHPELGLDAVSHALERPGEAPYLDPEGFRGLDEASAIAADFRRMEADPVGEASLRWRYGVTDAAAFPEARTVELANWVAQLGPAE